MQLKPFTAISAAIAAGAGLWEPLALDVAIRVRRGEIVRINTNIAHIQEACHYVMAAGQSDQVTGRAGHVMGYDWPELVSVAGWPQTLALICPADQRDWHLTETWVDRRLFGAPILIDMSLPQLTARFVFACSLVHGPLVNQILLEIRQ